MLEKRSENTWHLEQKWTPKGTLETSKGVPFSKHFCMWFSICFWGHFWIENWSKMGPKRGPKCDEKSLKIDSRARVPFWSDFGSIFWMILDQFGVDFGLILDRFWYDFSTHFRLRKTAGNRTKSPEIAGNRRTYRETKRNSREWWEIAWNL